MATKKKASQPKAAKAKQPPSKGSKGSQEITDEELDQVSGGLLGAPGTNAVVGVGGTNSVVGVGGTNSVVGVGGTAASRLDPNLLKGTKK